MPRLGVGVLSQDATVNRISPGLLLIGFFATLIGLAGAYAIKRGMAVAPTPEPPPVAKPAAPTVVISSIDLPVGRVVASGDIMTVPMSFAQQQANSFPPIMMTDGKQIVGRMLRESVTKWRPFTPESFYPEGTGPDISERLEPGLRAVTVPVHGVSGLVGQATPGMFVDVLFRATPTKDESVPEITKVLLQNVEILAIGENATPGMQGGIDPKSEVHAVTLAVTADQAQTLKIVEGHGDLSLLLRRPTDRVALPIEGPVTLRELLNLPEPTKPPGPFVAEIYRGGRRQTVTFSPNRVIDETFGGNPIQLHKPVIDNPPDDPPAAPRAPRTAPGNAPPSAPAAPRVVPPQPTPDVIPGSTRRPDVSPFWAG